MSTKTTNPAQGFNWDLYSDGYNGSNLRKNKKVGTNGKHTVIYSHEAYAEEAYNRFTNNVDAKVQEAPKDLIPGATLQLIDVAFGGKTTLLGITACGGTVEIDMNKEREYLRTFKHVPSPATFVNVVCNVEEVKQAFLASSPIVKIMPNLRASLFEGHCMQVSKRLTALMGSEDEYCIGRVVDVNSTGYYVSIDGVVCYMPGSYAPADFNSDRSVIGRDIPVYIINFVRGRGFVVSNSKYNEKVLPALMEKELFTDKRVRCRVTAFTKAKNVAYVVFDSDNKDALFSGLITPDECVSYMYEFLQSRTTDEDPVILNVGDVFYGYIHKFYLDDHKKVRIMIGDVPTTNSWYQQKQAEIDRQRTASATDQTAQEA